MGLLKFKQDVFGQQLLIGVDMKYIWVVVMAAVVVAAAHFIGSRTMLPARKTS